MGLSPEPEALGPLGPLEPLGPQEPLNPETLNPKPPNPGLGFRVYRPPSCPGNSQGVARGSAVDSQRELAGSEVSTHSNQESCELVCRL